MWIKVLLLLLLDKVLLWESAWEKASQMAKHESKYAGCRLFRRLYNKISTTYFLLKLIDNKNEFSVGKKNLKKSFF